MRHSRTGPLVARAHFAARDSGALLVRTPHTATDRLGSQSVCQLHGKTPKRIEKQRRIWCGRDGMDPLFFIENV